jgi:hypothetical protein
MAEFRTFDPVSTFQGARSNANIIRSQEQSIAAQPARNELAEFNLVQAKATSQQQQTTFNQSQELQKAKLVGQSATALLKLPPERRDAAFSSLIPQLQEFGVDTSKFQPGQFTDDNLKEAISNSIAITGGLEEEGFTLSQGQQRFGAGGQEIASVAPAPAKGTSLQQNLIAAGLTPGTPEFKAAVLKATTKPSTSISIGGSKKFQEKVSEGQAATFGRVGTEADAAIDANQSLDVLESIDVDTGALEPAKQGIAAFAAAFGIDSSGLANISKGEAFNAEAQRIVLSVKASQKGPQTDKDEVTIRKTVANLGNTRAGNQFIIDSARALNNRRIERKGFYDNFIEASGGNFKDASGKTADSAWSEFKRGTPMISSNLRTPEGLPVFFFKFESDVRNANPDASRAEIMEAWRSANKGVL